MGSDISAISSCPGCGAVLPEVDGPTHRYIGASPACWALYTALGGGGDPPLALSPWNALLVDGYAAQHPGRPSPQSIQSVAIHLLVLHGVFVAGVAPAQVMWLRRRVLRERLEARRAAFVWLDPPDFAGSLTVADIARPPTPQARAAMVEPYLRGVWERWSAPHAATVAAWYDRYVVPD